MIIIDTWQPSKNVFMGNVSFPGIAFEKKGFDCVRERLSLNFKISSSATKRNYRFLQEQFF